MGRHERASARRWVRAATLGLLLLALVARGLVPAGYMLARASSDDSLLTMTICTSHGPQQIAVPDGLNPKPDQKAPLAAIEPCAFAHAIASGGPPADVATLAHAIYPHAKLERAVDNLIGQRVVLGAPLGSRAPPRLS